MFRMTFIILQKKTDSKKGDSKVTTMYMIFFLGGLLYLKKVKEKKRERSRKVTTMYMILIFLVFLSYLPNFFSFFV